MAASDLRTPAPATGGDEECEEGVWSQSLMTSLFFAKGIAPEFDKPCFVRITNQRIEIRYYTADSPQRYPNTSPQTEPPLQYYGPNNGDGHFVLWNGQQGRNKCYATLHREPRAPNMLVGSWEEDGERIGLWQVKLIEGFARW